MPCESYIVCPIIRRKETSIRRCRQLTSFNRWMEEKPGTLIKYSKPLRPSSATVDIDILILMHSSSPALLGKQLALCPFPRARPTQDEDNRNLGLSRYPRRWRPLLYRRTPAGAGLRHGSNRHRRRVTKTQGSAAATVRSPPGQRSCFAEDAR